MSSNLVKASAILQQCISIVSKFVECHDPLQFKLIDGGNGVYVLQNIAAPIFVSGNPQFYLLRVKNSKSLFLHVCLTLKPQKMGAAIDSNHEFEGASLQFFQGIDKLFCRAEWDVKKKKDKLEHPQPHWHWGYPDEIIAEVFHAQDNIEGGFQEQIEAHTPVDNDIPNIDFEEIHYAMSSKWATSDISVEEFTPQHFYGWMRRCIYNVIDQYNYQVNKSGFTSAKDW